MIPDPRRYGSGTAAEPLLRLDERTLVATMRDLASRRRDDDIRAALAAAPSRDAYARLWLALCAAIEKPVNDESITPRIFAIPWVIVCSATADAVIDGVLRDVTGIANVLESHGVFGPSRNLGLSNALCSIDTLEGLASSTVLEWSRTPAARDVAPAPITLKRGEETVHVRFLLGAAIAAQHAPDIVETGANVAAWGTLALHAMAAQLAAPNAQLLPMPRPPAGLYSAAYAGRRAGIEAGFNLFMANAVRRFRLAVGDPSMTIATHEGGELRVTLWTALDDSMIEGFRWPLHPADDLEEIARTITTLAEECRVLEPETIPRVLADRTSTGAVRFETSPRCDAG